MIPRTAAARVLHTALAVYTPDARRATSACGALATKMTGTSSFVTDTSTPPPTADTTPTKTDEITGRPARSAYAVPVTAKRPKARAVTNVTSHTIRVNHRPITSVSKIAPTTVARYQGLLRLSAGRFPIRKSRMKPPPNPISSAKVDNPTMSQWCSSSLDARNDPTSAFTPTVSKANHNGVLVARSGRNFMCAQRRIAPDFKSSAHEPSDDAVAAHGYHGTVGDATGDRSRHFPAIEKKHGEPIKVWIERLNDLGDAKYPEQIAYLRENHGFSQAHANALVMYVRGSASSKRFVTPEAYFKSLDPATAGTAREIFEVLGKSFPRTELVVAWNQPMLRLGTQYVFGLSAAKKHLTLNPFSSSALEECTDLLEGYEVNKKTFKVPVGWKVNARLLRALVKARLTEIS